MLGSVQVPSVAKLFLVVYRDTGTTAAASTSCTPLTCFPTIHMEVGARDHLREHEILFTIARFGATPGQHGSTFDLSMHPTLNAIFHRFPYLLPNLVGASIALAGLPMVFFFLKETKHSHGDKIDRR